MFSTNPKTLLTNVAFVVVVMFAVYHFAPAKRTITGA